MASSAHATYLSLFVDPAVPWDGLIRDLYAKRASKKEVEDRIAFCVVNGQRGKVQANKGDTWLAIGHTFDTYKYDDWSGLYQEIKNEDQRILGLTKELLEIPYQSVEEIAKGAVYIWTLNYLTKTWQVPEPQAATIVALTGLRIIEKWARNKPQFENRSLRGQYHTLRSIFSFANKNGIDIVKCKRTEVSNALGVPT